MGCELMDTDFEQKQTKGTKRHGLEDRGEETTFAMPS